MLESERAAVASACRRLAAEGLVIGTGGNVSLRAGEHVVITASGAVLADVEPSALVVVEESGTVAEGEAAPTSELALHLGVYRRFEAAAAVIHTHAPVATALSCVLDEVPAVHYQMLAFGGAVPVAPYETFGTEQLAIRVLDALEGHTAALMRNHGSINWGTDMGSALDNALLLEWACTLYWRARMLGTPSVLSGEQLRDVIDVAQRLNYGSTTARHDSPGGP